MGFTPRPKEKQQKVKAPKRQRMEDLGKFALELFTENPGDNPIPMTGVNPAYSVKMNKELLCGYNLLDYY